MSNRLLFSLLLGFLLVGGIVGAKEPATSPSPDTQAKEQNKILKPKVYRFTDRSGQIVELLVYEQGIKLLAPKEKAAILMFYIYTGSPCRHELQLFSKLAPNHKDLTFVTFELKGLKPDGFPAFEKELGIKGLHMIDSAQARPFAQFIAQITGWTGAVPLIIALDKKGNVQHMQLGAMNEEQLKKLFAALQA
jgi:hypothetical protein